jgi:hypothetical protein
MPRHSWSRPGRNPGVSTSVSSGTLNASHQRTKRAPLIELSMSSAPASWLGWLATTPTAWPPMRPSPTVRLDPKRARSSTNQPSSTRSPITSRTS